MTRGTPISGNLLLRWVLVILSLTIDNIYHLKKHSEIGLMFTNLANELGHHPVPTARLFQLIVLPATHRLRQATQRHGLHRRLPHGQDVQLSWAATRQWWWGTKRGKQRSGCFLDFLGMSSYFLVFLGISWYFMVFLTFHGISWHFLVSHGISWYFAFPQAEWGNEEVTGQEWCWKGHSIV